MGDPTQAVQVLLLYIFKVTRIMVLWIALYTLDKVWQDEYVRSLVENEENGDEKADPPSLLPIIVMALGMEAIVMMVIVLVLCLVRINYGGANSRFLIDQRMLRMLGVDYFISTVLLLLLGVGVSAAAQDLRILRYREDGMRGIRATCTILLLCAAVVLLLPLYRLG